MISVLRGPPKLVSAARVDVDKAKDEASTATAKNRPAEAAAPMITLYISGGRKDKLRPGDILGALTGEAGGLPGAEIGKIEIHERFSYVAIARDSAKRAIECLGAGRIKGKKFKVGIPK
jgi:hypothetical protein